MDKKTDKVSFIETLRRDLCIFFKEFDPIEPNIKLEYFTINRKYEYKMIMVCMSTSEFGGFTRSYQLDFYDYSDLLAQIAGEYVYFMINYDGIENKWRK